MIFWEMIQNLNKIHDFILIKAISTVEIFMRRLSMTFAVLGIVLAVMVLIASNVRLSQQDTATVPLQSVAVRILDENGNPTPSRVRFTGVDSTLLSRGTLLHPLKIRNHQQEREV